MNHSNSNTFRLTNEQLLLVNILNTMYNDNLRHINSITETLNSLTQTNNQIRISLGQLLHSNQNTYTNNTRRNNHRHSQNTSTNHFDRDMINNQPFIIDSISEYTIPRNRRYSTLDSYAQSVFNIFLQPVDIYPTQSQIESATRRVVYCDIARPVNTSCPISMDDFNDTDMVTVIRHCGHTFHTEYLMNWFSTNCRCPVCRYDIRDYNNTSSEYFNSPETTIDSSNNNLERNTTNNTRNRFNEEDINENSISSLENILNTGIFDASGNYTTNPTDMLASLLIHTLNRNRNTR
jgi:hypothetical protein